MIEIQGILVSLELFSKRFCCDLPTCKGCCCEEGDAGAPVETDEIAEMEAALDTVWDELTPQARRVIEKDGVVYSDPSGELVTSIVDGRDCVFANHDDKGVCYCVLDKAYREGRIRFQKPVSCHLYPVRVKTMGDTVGLNYDRWDICSCACALGDKIGMPLYEFLKDPLVRRFGMEWWQECHLVAQELKKAGYV